MKCLPNRALDIYLNLKYRNKLILTCILAGVIPLITLGIFCYRQTHGFLLDKERDALSSAIDTAYNSLDYQIQLYENLVTYLALSETIVNVSSVENLGIIEKFEMLHYDYDVLLENIYIQHPEIAQITLYVTCFTDTSSALSPTWSLSAGTTLWQTLPPPSGIWTRTAICA